MSIAAEWNPKQAALRAAVADIALFDDALRLCLELHGSVHAAPVSGAQSPTIFDALCEGLDDGAFRYLPPKCDGFGRRASIAWNIWHITRIEDLAANVMMTDGKQIFDDGWLDKIGATIQHTGNGMTDDEIGQFSRSIDVGALLSYRRAVGIRTREVVVGLARADLTRKMKRESMRRILSEGGVTEHEKSIWLLGYWGKKTVAGILLMPITRHQMMHISDSFKLKDAALKIQKG